MRHLIIYIIIFCPTVLCAQISSETSYFFDTDIDTILNQLYTNKFKSLEVVIENHRASKEYRIENYSYQRLNDTIIQVTTKGYSQNYYYDFKSKRYQFFDSLHPRTYFLNPNRCEKDSAGYKVIYSCNLNLKDSIYQFYIRLKTDSQDRIIYDYYSDRQSKYTQELLYNYSGDTIVFTKNSILRTGQKIIMYSDTTVTQTIISAHTKTVKQTIKSQNKYFNSGDSVFKTTLLTKTYLYDINGNLSHIDYREKGSDGGKEKATLKVVYRSN